MVWSLLNTPNKALGLTSSIVKETTGVGGVKQSASEDLVPETDKRQTRDKFNLDAKTL